MCVRTVPSEYQVVFLMSVEKLDEVFMSEGQRERERETG